MEKPVNHITHHGIKATVNSTSTQAVHAAASNLCWFFQHVICIDVDNDLRVSLS